MLMIMMFDLIKNPKQKKAKVYSYNESKKL